MKRMSLVLLILAGLAAPTHAACNTAPALALQAKPLPAKPARTLDVAEQQSAEGGEWQVYLDKAGKRPQRIQRVDFGETGRATTQISVASATAFVVSQTMETYSAPIGTPGSKTVKSQHAEFVFCDGRLQPPAGRKASAAFTASARAAAETIFAAPEIAGELKAAGFRPPIWK